MAKVLFIEDDKDQIDLYSIKFKMEGLKIIIAQDGIEGLRMAVEEKPDFILIDIVLEKMDGVEVLRRLKKDSRTKDIPAVILTNLLKKDLAKETKKLGALDFWAKTDVLPQEVVNRIRGYLKIRR